MTAAGCGDDGAIADFDPGVDQCTSQSDIELLATLQADAGPPPDGGIGNTEMGAIQEHCARTACLSEVLDSENPPDCLRDCISNSSAGALTAGCIDCQVFSITCAASRCAIVCLTGTSSECTECSESMCGTVLDACVGSPP